MSGDESGHESDGRRPIRRALVSVYDKVGLDDLARALHAAGVEIVSTGSTARQLAGLGIPVVAVEDLTGFPESLDGRVKTLHPAVHAGLLADQRRDTHREQLAELGVAPFDLLVSNLYPFTDTVASGADAEECIEQIDIGGPAMVRAAAKNHASVAVLTSPTQYPDALTAFGQGGFTLEQRRRLATAAFAHTAAYDVAVASWMSRELVDTTDGTGFPAFAGIAWARAAGLRYGENPHQRAALYVNPVAWDSLATAEQLAGKEMSYNNYVDTDAALRAANEQGDRPTVAVVKHANPCGIAIGPDVAAAHAAANACDPVSAYGGVIATNRPVTLEMARQVAEVFTEVIVAPAYDEGTVEVLRARKNLRILRTGGHGGMGLEFRQICGGALLQTADDLGTDGDDPRHWTLAAGGPVDEATMADLAFAWRACRSVKSNAILLAASGASVGIGMGQVNRVDSCRLAVRRAGARAVGSVAASDAYFPFDDGAQVLFEAGVKAVVEPGGSKRDQDTIEAARAAGVSLYLTGTRHFAH